MPEKDDVVLFGFEFVRRAREGVVSPGDKTFGQLDQLTTYYLFWHFLLDPGPITV